MIFRIHTHMVTQNPCNFFPRGSDVFESLGTWQVYDAQTDKQENTYTLQIKNQYIFLNDVEVINISFTLTSSHIVLMYWSITLLHKYIQFLGLG